jgi:probable phosphomutase (TIGR03848 family)
VPTLLLIRHARSTANAAGILAGWTDGVGLDQTGREQAARLQARLSGLPLTRLVSSPLQRCLETASIVTDGAVPVLDERLGETHYGDWTGRPLAELAKEPLWSVVQRHPSAARFPGEDAESIADVQHRAVNAVREHDREIAAEAGPDAVWAAFSHGDVIASILADALGMHLDSYQRILVSPCSVSVIRYTSLRPFVLRMNDSGDDLPALTAPPTPAAPTAAAPTAAASDAVVGGDA